MTGNDTERIIGVLLQDVKAEKITISGVHIGDVYQLPEPPPLWHNVPVLPNHFVGRVQLVDELVQQMVSDRTPALAVHGLPGAGKSTLAVVLAHHPELLEHFTDGVLWTSLAPNADIMILLSTWANALDIEVNEGQTPEQLQQEIRSKIGQRKILLIIDDVWEAEAAEFMRCGGPNCSHLLTTRDLGIARVFTEDSSRVFAVPSLPEEPAFQLLQLLAKDACATNQSAARKLTLDVGGLPLALVLIGGFLAAPEQSLFPELSEEALEEIDDPARRLELAGKRLGAADRGQVKLQETIALSLEYLPQSAVDTFYALGAFAPEPANFDLDAAQSVTGTDLKTLAILVARNLVMRTDSSRLALHRVLADFIRPNVNHNTRLRHAEYYASIAMRVYRDYGDNIDHKIKGEPENEREIYKPEQAQIEAAWRWVMHHGPSAEIDEMLVKFTYLTAFVPSSEPYELRKKIKRLNVGVEAANRIGDSVVGFAFLRVMARHLQVNATIQTHRGNLVESIKIYQQAIDAVQAAKIHPDDWNRILSGKLGEIYPQYFGTSLEYSLLHELGEVYRANGEPARAIECYQDALEYVRKGDDLSWYSSLLNNMSRAHIALKQYPQAIEVLKQRLGVLQDTSADNSATIETLYSLGFCSYNLGDKQEALAYVLGVTEKVVAEGESKTGNKQGTLADADLENMVPISLDDARITNESLRLAARIFDDFNQPEKAAQYRQLQFVLLVQLYEKHTTTGREKTEVLAQLFGHGEISKYEIRRRDLIEQLAHVCKQLGSYFFEENDFQNAIIYLEYQLQFVRALGVQTEEIVVLKNLGVTHALMAWQSFQLTSMREAVSYFGAGYALANQLDNQAAKAEFQDSLKKVQAQLAFLQQFTQGEEE